MNLLGIFSDHGGSRRRGVQKNMVSSMAAFWRTVERSLSPEEKKIEKMFVIKTLVLGSVLFFAATSSAYLREVDYEFWPEAENDVFVSDDFSFAEEGFFGKSSIPTVSNTDRSSVSEVISYEVQAGESLFLIASKFGLRTRTLLDNNDIPNPNSLTAGMQLDILPVDGLLYKVKSGNTLSGIAKKYDVSVESLQTQNGITNEKGLVAGKVIILPGVKWTKPAVVVSKPAQTTKKPVVASSPKKTFATPTVPVIPKKYTAPSKGAKMVWPVAGRGQVTQKFRRGHYAYDIWGGNRPAILAAKGGTVEQASGGCKVGYKRCNHGYGNFIIIDHGGGLKTLYAHNTVLYVKKNQKITAGQAIAKMGNTGNVRGRTGIHLHFEVRLNGRKMNPGGYLY